MKVIYAFLCVVGGDGCGESEAAAREVVIFPVVCGMMVRVVVMGCGMVGGKNYYFFR